MRAWLILAVAAVTLALPPLLPERQLSVFVLLMLAATVTAGVSLLMGYAGHEQYHHERIDAAIEKVKAAGK